MSVKIAGLCYDITFGCPKRKAVAVALADHADHDGANVFPSIALVARKVEWSERTVQRVLRELEQIGILIIVNPGGAGPKDTRQWAFDVALLHDLASGDYAIKATAEGDSETPLEGDSLTPFLVVRVTDGQIRVTGSASKGDYADTRTVNNHHIEPSTRVRACAKEAAHASRARLILRGDVHWSAWVAWTEHNMGSRASRMFQDAGGLVAFADKPHAGCQDPALPPGTGSARWAELMAERQQTIAVGDAA